MEVLGRGATLPTDKRKKVGEILIFRIPKTQNTIVVLNVRIGMGSCGVVCLSQSALCARISRGVGPQSDSQSIRRRFCLRVRKTASAALSRPAGNSLARLGCSVWRKFWVRACVRASEWRTLTNGIPPRDQPPSNPFAHHPVLWYFNFKWCSRGFREKGPVAWRAAH